MSEGRFTVPIDIIEEIKQRKSGGQTVYEPNIHPFLVVELGKQGKTIVQRCAEFNICRQTYYNWKLEYPEFEKASRLADVHAQAWWEDFSRRGASGEIPNFNATAMIFRMKSQFKEDYMERKEIQVNNTIVSLTQEDLIKRAAKLVNNSPELLDILKSHPALAQLNREEVIEGELAEIEYKE